MTRRRFKTDRDRWEAILLRDPKANNQFVYGVTTTGIYCRPSCPARRPLPKHVRYFDTAAAAEKAGFRPCRRCHPQHDRAANPAAGLVAAACRMLANSDAAPKLEALASQAHLSPSHFHRLFKREVGLTPKGYAVALRTQRVRDQLSRGSKVTTAIYHAGFNSNGRFYAASAKILGMKPKQFTAGGADATIRFAVGQCSLGAILVAASATGVCAITLGDDPEFLLRDLQDRFPAAHLVGADRAFEQVVARVVAFVEAPTIGLDLPLDIRGTAFQQRVWQELMRIPCGQTRSYAEIAARLGKPNAVRAVAGACAANHIAVAIPCHRVVRTGGSLSGYRWGVARKARLLDSERSA